RAAAAHSLRTLPQYRVLDVGHGKCPHHAAVQSIDDLRRGAGRREQAAPADYHHAWIAGLYYCWCCGKLLVALFTQRSEQTELSRFTGIRGPGHGRECERNLPGHQMGDRRLLPLVWNMRKFDSSSALQQLAHQMGQITDAERAIVELTGARFGPFDEVLDRIDPGSGIDHRTHWIGSGLGNRGETAKRVI